MQRREKRCSYGVTGQGIIVGQQGIHKGRVKYHPISHNVLSTSSLISPSFQGDPTIFHKGIFFKKTLILRINMLIGSCNFTHPPYCWLKERAWTFFIASPWLRLMPSNVQPNRHAKPNQAQSRKERQKEGGGGRGHYNMHNKLQSSQIHDVTFQFTVGWKGFVLLMLWLQGSNKSLGVKKKCNL